MNIRSVIHSLLGLGLVVPAAFAGPKLRTHDGDARDHAFCQYYLGGPASDDHFAEVDPLQSVLPRLEELTHRNQRTFKSLSQVERIRLMADVGLVNVIGYARAHVGRPMPLDQVYRAYLESLWLRMAYHVRTDSPYFFVGETGLVPNTFEEFVQERMTAFQLRFPKPVDVGPVLSLLVQWLPRGPGERFRALTQLMDEVPMASSLADLLLGGDPLAALLTEIARERRDDHSPVGVGALRERIFAEYADLELLWKHLGKMKGKTLVDLNAGIGRAGFSLAAQATGARYIGYEGVGSRVDEGMRMAGELNLKASEWRVEHLDVTAPGFDLPFADVYLLSNGFFPSDLERIFAKLGERAREGREFTVVMAYEPLFSEAGLRWPKEYGPLAEVFPALPPWLKWEKVVQVEDDGYDATFFLLRAQVAKR